MAKFSNSIARLRFSDVSSCPLFAGVRFIAASPTEFVAVTLWGTLPAWNYYVT